MDTTELLPLLEQLDDHVDDLEEALEPILGRSVSKVSKNLPLMDKAKLHALITYTLESFIFSYLRLQGVDAKQHPVFREIKRVQQYFEKIKALETEPEQRTMTLDKEAAGRFIKHGLAGNNKIDLELAEKQARENAKAQIKANLLARKAAAQNQNPSAESQDPSSIAPSTAQSADSDDDSDDDMQEEVDPDTPNEVTKDQEGLKKKKKSKEEKAKTRSKDAKAAKKIRKLDKAERTEEKKMRRQKKEELRKSRKAN